MLADAKNVALEREAITWRRLKKRSEPGDVALRWGLAVGTMLWYFT